MGSASWTASKISLVSGGRYFEKKPNFSACLFPGGPVAFLLPGWPPLCFGVLRLSVWSTPFNCSLHLSLHFHPPTVFSEISSISAMRRFSIFPLCFLNISKAWSLFELLCLGNAHHLSFVVL